MLYSNPESAGMELWVFLDRVFWCTQVLISVGHMLCVRIIFFTLTLLWLLLSSLLRREEFLSDFKKNNTQSITSKHLWANLECVPVSASLWALFGERTPKAISSVDQRQQLNRQREAASTCQAFQPCTVQAHLLCCHWTLASPRHHPQPPPVLPSANLQPRFWQVHRCSFLLYCILFLWRCVAGVHLGCYHQAMQPNFIKNKNNLTSDLEFFRIKLKLE